jgi:XTP/dITP diphosphohydrolase
MVTLIVATHNEHKVIEIQEILGNGFACISLKQFAQAPVPIEDAPDFVGNAMKKALTTAKWLQLNPQQISRLNAVPQATFVLADDSGLEVDFLNGAPGVYSARFARDELGVAGNAPADANNQKLLRLLHGVPKDKRTARFRCAIALIPLAVAGTKNASPVCYADEFEQSAQVFEGRCEGIITDAPRGTDGFGYDPLFIPEGCDQTFGELPESIKNQISHRARALHILKQRLAEQIM